MSTPYVSAWAPARRYLSSSAAVVPGAVVLFGAPYDSTTSFRPGARFAPDAIRDASVGIETYSPDLDADLEDVLFADLGNLDVPFGAPAPMVRAVEHATEDLLDAGAKPFLLGGEHSVTPGAIRAVARRFPDLVVVQLDAHADLRPEYLGEQHSHASAMRRAMEALRPDSLLQVGIRSGTREEFVEMRTSGRLVTPTGPALAAALARFEGRPVYLTVDLDVFDPAHMPGTGTPEPGGIDWPTFVALLAALPDGALVAADVVELAPTLDPSGCSSVLAAKAVREIVLRLA